MDISTLIDQKDSLHRYGLLAERLPDGSLRANVPHLKHHSSGFDCGYGGSGPADLALSVLHSLLPPVSKEEEKAQHDLPISEFYRVLDDPTRWTTEMGLRDKVRVNNLAWLLHQKFKEEFIAKMPESGGHISIELIMSWIAKEKEAFLQQRQRGQ